jgi:hypothetical protein
MMMMIIMMGFHQFVNAHLKQNKTEKNFASKVQMGGNEWASD